MSVIDDAVVLENKAEDNYRASSKEISDPGAAKILVMLADEEAKHAAILKGLRSADELQGPDLVEEARSWVKGSVEGGVGKISPDANLLAVLRRSMDIEKMTEDFYREHATESDDAQLEQLFHQLADIEKKHFLFVSSLVEYYNRPNEWVEDAEFGVRPEY